MFQKIGFFELCTIAQCLQVFDYYTAILQLQLA